MSREQPPEPFFIGYLVKRTAKKTEWLSAAAVEEIGSVSTCISEAPDYVNAWKHNALCLFNDEASAWGLVPEANENGPYDTYAYKLLLIAFDHDAEQHIAKDDLPDFGMFPIECAPLVPEFEFIGYDCVQTGWNQGIMGFGCSPLSCNGMASEIAVNRFCLIDTYRDALDAARKIAKEQPEPGIYYVLEVWRKRRSAPAP